MQVVSGTRENGVQGYLARDAMIAVPSQVFPVRFWTQHHVRLHLTDLTDQFLAEFGGVFQATVGTVQVDQLLDPQQPGSLRLLLRSGYFQFFGRDLMVDSASAAVGT